MEVKKKKLLYVEKQGKKKREIPRNFAYWAVL